MTRLHFLFAAVFLPMLAGVAALAVAKGDDSKIPLTITGGHETDKRDGGRPVVLIAAALDVKPEVFREAFSGVTPAKGGPPTGEQARRNKEALLKVLAPHGITNDRLDEVSDYYRYKPQDGGLWKHSPAKGHAVVENGKIKEIVITDPGSGYNSTPTIQVKGFDKTEFKATIAFGKELKGNGSLKRVEVVEQ